MQSYKHLVFGSVAPRWQIYQRDWKVNHFASVITTDMGHAANKANNEDVKYRQKNILRLARSWKIKHKCNKIVLYLNFKLPQGIQATIL